MGTKIVNQLQMSLMMLLLMIASMATAANSKGIGTIVFVTGQATIERESIAMPVTSDLRLHAGDTIHTQENGKAYIRFDDQGLITLEANSELLIEAYQKSEIEEKSAFKFTLRKGQMRSITGNGAQQHKNRYRLNTPVAAIGVRGTDFITKADDLTTQVKVITGGVIVSPFNDQCSPLAVGPCENEAAKELFASNTQYLQIQKGMSAPEIKQIQVSEMESESDNSAETWLAEINESSGESETSNSESTESSNQTTLNTEIDRTNWDKDQVIARIDEIDQQLESNGVTEVKPTELFWGRWENFEAPEGANYVVASSDYAIYRQLSSAYQAPQGIVAFDMVNAQAAYVNGYRTYNATVTDAQMQIDFNRSSFETNLTVNSEGQNFDLTSKGSVLATGVLRSVSLPGSNTTLQGALNHDATEAATLFNRTYNANERVHGLINWTASD